MLTSELGWLSEHFKSSLLIQQPGATIVQWLDFLNQWLLVKTGFADFSQQARVSSQGISFWSWTNQLYMSIEGFVLAAYVTFTFVVRLTILVLATPLFMLAALTGFVDGLIRRDLRKFGAWRESSFVYHRAKRAVIPLADRALGHLPIPALFTQSYSYSFALRSNTWSNSRDHSDDVQKISLNAQLNFF